MTLGGWSSFWNTVQHLEGAMDRRTAPRWRDGVWSGGNNCRTWAGFQVLAVIAAWPTSDPQPGDSSPWGWQEAFLCPLLQPRMPPDCYQEEQGKPGSSLGLRPRRILGKQSYLEVLEKRKLKRKKNYYYHGGSKAIGLAPPFGLFFKIK